MLGDFLQGSCTSKRRAVGKVTHHTPDPLTSDFYLNPTCSHNLLKVDSHLNFGTNSVFGKAKYWAHEVFAKVIFVSLSFSKRAQLGNWAESDPDPVGASKAGQRNRGYSRLGANLPLARSFHPLQWAFSPHFANTPSTRLLFHHDLGLNPRPLTPHPGHAFTGCLKNINSLLVNLCNVGRRRSW